jgi:hypothetical protein
MTPLDNKIEEIKIINISHLFHALIKRTIKEEKAQITI